jgi:hypothetical protein
MAHSVEMQTTAQAAIVTSASAALQKKKKSQIYMHMIRRQRATSPKAQTG